MHGLPLTLSPDSGATVQRLKTVLGLFKLRIGFMIMITALVGLAVTPGPFIGWVKVFTVAWTVLLASASAGAFNQYYERDTDHLMARTRRRAFVIGSLRPSPGWLVLMAMLLVVSVATAAWVLNPVAAVFVFLGAFFYAVVYTVWLKRRSWLNIVVGGLAGSFAVLAGAAAVNPALGPLPFLLAAVLFLWTPPHFWSLAIANQTEYAAAGVPMLPVVIGTQRAAWVVLWSTLALAVTSVLPFWFGAGVIYLMGALVGSAYFVFKAWRLALAPSRQTAMASFFASLFQLSALLLAATLDSLLL